MVAVSPQTTARNLAVKEKHRLAFPVLSDAGLAWSRELALPFTVGDPLRKVYEGFGLLLPDYNGDDSWQLPIPARLVVDREGVIRSIDADPDYTRRPEPEATLEVLRGLG